MTTARKPAKKKETETEKARKLYPIEVDICGETFILSVEAAERIADDLVCKVLAYRDGAR